MSKIYLGIDPGITGAIASISGNAIKLQDMPVLKAKKGKTVKQSLDLHSLALILQEYLDLGCELHCTVELLTPMPGGGQGQQRGAVGSFKIGQYYGAVLGILAALSIPYQLVTPVSWKRRFRLLSTEKDEARARALELYPQCAKELRYKANIGRADALLIARYGEDQDQRVAA